MESNNLHFNNNYAKWKRNDSPKFQNIIQIEKWNESGVEKFKVVEQKKENNSIYCSQYQVEWNRIGMEMEWNFHNKISPCTIEWKWNGSRMVIEWVMNGQPQ